MSKAEDMVAPSGDGVSNTTVLALTLDTTARNIPLPAYMYGEYIRMTPFGANVYWFLSSSADADVDRTTAAGATAALASAVTRGSRLDNGTTIERLCPGARQGQSVYLCWQGSAAGELFQIEKASGKPMAVTADT
jgi:hypothetical protein